MYLRPSLAHPPIVTTLAAAAVAALVGIGLLSAVTGLFQHDGAPFGRVAVAEHACTSEVSVSTRAACARSYLSVQQAQRVASG